MILYHFRISTLGVQSFENEFRKISEDMSEWDKNSKKGTKWRDEENERMAGLRMEWRRVVEKEDGGKQINNYLNKKKKKLI